MLKTRVIPCLDVENGYVVKGVRFRDLNRVGDPVEIAKRYDAENADELCYLDVKASEENRRTLLSLVERTAENCAIPLTVGGGVRSASDVRDLMLAGADKVALNSAAVKDPSIIASCAARFGSQAIVAAIDAKRVSTNPNRLTWEIFTHGGKKSTGVDALAYAREIAHLGAGEILLTSMDRDGATDGFDLALVRTIADAVRIPVVASGGAGKVEHFVSAVLEGHASAVLAASVFHYGVLKIGDVKHVMNAAGIPVRLT